MIKKMHYILRLFRINPVWAFAKMVSKLFGKAEQQAKLNHILNNKTYFNDDERYIVPINSFIKLPGSDLVKEFRKDILYYTRKILNHEFNLLGSGNLKVNTDYKINEREAWLRKNISANNLKESFKLDENLKYSPYTFINWQKDFQSNFIWQVSKGSSEIKYGANDGTDIKVPWELGRMQHLSALALACLFEEDEDFENPDKYYDEFKNEIIDFVSSNPPGFGVQWMSSMDIAIRAVNWLFAKDLFNQIEAERDSEFDYIFNKSIYEHADYIANNLEWSDGMRANHYLANICGLIIIASYLQSNEVTDNWLQFSIQELTNEINHQFLNDGGNFEASIPYHFLSTEMILYSLFYLFNIDSERIRSIFNSKKTFSIGKKSVKPLSYNKLLFIDSENKLRISDQLLNKMDSIGNFCEKNIKRNGLIDIIGDDDSGRFIKILPFKRELKNFLFDNYYSSILNLYKYFKYCVENDRFDKININRIFETEDIPIGEEISQKTENSEIIRFDNFGLYIYNEKQYRVSLRCGSVGQNGKGGHSHNDQLSFCLDVRGREIIVDSGTYKYTADFRSRNKFRSTARHNTLVIDGLEQNQWFEEDKDDLFWIKKDRTKSKIINFSNEMISASHSAFGSNYKRTILFEENEINFLDECNTKKQKYIAIHLHPGIKPVKVKETEILIEFKDFEVIIISESNKIEIDQSVYSPEYGITLHNKVLKIPMQESKTEWKILINS